MRSGQQDIPTPGLNRSGVFLFFILPSQNANSLCPWNKERWVARQSLLNKHSPCPFFLTPRTMETFQQVQPRWREDMEKIKVVSETAEDQLHTLWEEKCNINRMCFRHTKGGVDSFTTTWVMFVIALYIVPAMQLSLSPGWSH